MDSPPLWQSAAAKARPILIRRVRGMTLEVNDTVHVRLGSVCTQLSGVTATSVVGRVKGSRPDIAVPESVAIRGQCVESRTPLSKLLRPRFQHD